MRIVISEFILSFHCRREWYVGGTKTMLIKPKGKELYVGGGEGKGRLV